MVSTPPKLSHLSCCSGPKTPPVVHTCVASADEEAKEKQQNQSHVFGDILVAIQRELALFRSALRLELSSSNDQLKRDIEQLLCKATNEEEKDQFTLPIDCPQNSTLRAQSVKSEKISTNLLELPPPLEENSAQIVSFASSDHEGQSKQLPCKPNMLGSCSSNSLEQSQGVNVSQSIEDEITRAGQGSMLTRCGSDIDGQRGANVTKLASDKTTLTARTAVACNTIKTKFTRGSHGERSLFVNVNKALVDVEELDTPIYDVSVFYHETGIFRDIAASEWFQNFTMFMIISNSIYLGLDANENKADNMLEYKWYFLLGENIFAIFFCVEWAIRFFAFKSKVDCLKDMWFKFDSLLVFLMVIETWVMLAVAGTVSLPTGPLRLVRLLRLARMTRLMRALPELVTMVRGLASASRAVGSSLLMIALLVYVFAILMHSFLMDSALTGNFQTIPRTMWTLLIDGVFMDSTGSLLWTMIRKGEVLGIIVFLIFVLLSAMTVMNMLIGVLCEVVSKVAEAEKENHAILHVKGTLLTMLKRLDVDGSGDITKEELLGVLRDSDGLKVLQDLQVDCFYLLNVMDMMFAGSRGNSKDRGVSHRGRGVHLAVILECILAHRGDKASTVQDIIHCHEYTRWWIKEALDVHTKMLETLIEKLTGFEVDQLDMNPRLSDNFVAKTTSGNYAQTSVNPRTSENTARISYPLV